MIYIFSITIVSYIIMIITNTFNKYKFLLLTLFISLCIYDYNKILGLLLFIISSIVLYYKFNINNNIPSFGGNNFNIIYPNDNNQYFQNGGSNDIINIKNNNIDKNNIDKNNETNRDINNTNQLNYIMNTMQPMPDEYFSDDDESVFTEDDDENNTQNYDTTNVPQMDDIDFTKGSLDMNDINETMKPLTQDKLSENYIDNVKHFFNNVKLKKYNTKSKIQNNIFKRPWKKIYKSNILNDNNYDDNNDIYKLENKILQSNLVLN